MPAEATHSTRSVAPVRDAIDRLEAAAAKFSVARDPMHRGQPSHDAIERANAALRKVERAFTRPEGLVTRPLFRNLIYVADEDNGYANMVFPSVNEAMRAGMRRGLRGRLRILLRGLKRRRGRSARRSEWRVGPERSF